MTIPARLLLSRKRGFNLQEASRALNGLPALRVSRPGPWGNPFAVWRDDVGNWTVSCDGRHWKPETNDRQAALILAVKLYRQWLAGDGVQNPLPPTRSEIVAALRGKNLACWCPHHTRQGKPSPCHADVLLEMANAPLCEEVAISDLIAAE